MGGVAARARSCDPAGRVKRRSAQRSSWGAGPRSRRTCAPVKPALRCHACAFSCLRCRGSRSDPDVMLDVAEALHQQGFTIADSPRLVTADDTKTADLVITIGCDAHDITADNITEWVPPLLSETSPARWKPSTTAPNASPTNSPALTRRHQHRPEPPPGRPSERFAG